MAPWSGLGTVRFENGTSRAHCGTVGVVNASSWALALVVLAPLHLGCTEQSRSAPQSGTARYIVVREAGARAPGAPEASASPAHAAAPDAALPSFTEWTAPAAVDALLRGAILPRGDKDPLSCNFDMPQQSCIPGPDAVMWGCRGECAETCSGCASACIADMTACRAICAGGDAPCERACGSGAGACLQSCLGARDRCATGVCGKRVAEYQHEVATNYGCKPKRSALDICKRTVACMTACDAPSRSDAQREACRAACKKTHAPGCNAGFLQNVDMSSCFAYEDPV
jgi:hypothetical protein